MKVLQINGSANGEQSSTQKIIRAFLNGMNSLSNNDVHQERYKMDIDFDSRMLEALAEKLGVALHVVEMVDPYIGEDTGNSKDEWHYGYSFDIPAYEDLDAEIQTALKAEIDIDDFPFGKSLYFTDGEIADTKADPLGWRAEYEEDQYYQKYALPKEQVVRELMEIEEKIHIADDSLIIKALIFSAFSITESFVRSMIWTKIPEIDTSVSDEQLRGFLKEHLSKIISTAKGRQEVYREFTGQKLGSMPHVDPFRHSLAHDIGSAKVEAGRIIVTKKEPNDSAIGIDCILQDLKKYVLTFDD